MRKLPIFLMIGLTLTMTSFASASGCNLYFASTTNKELGHSPVVKVLERKGYNLVSNIYDANYYLSKMTSFGPISRGPLGSGVQVNTTLKDLETNMTLDVSDEVSFIFYPEFTKRNSIDAATMNVANKIPSCNKFKKMVEKELKLLSTDLI